MNLQEMVVTNAEGKIQTADGKDLTGQCIQSEDMYSFYAIKKVNDPSLKPASDQMASKVKIMMPLGGELNGMYRFPRVGEKVVVAIDGNSYYLMGYLPTAKNPFADKDDNNKEKTEAFDKEGLVLRYKKTGKNVADENRDEKYSEIGFYKEPSRWQTTDENLQNTEKSVEVEDKEGNKTYYPYIDTVKVSSTGDLTSNAQNLNEIKGRRIAIESKFLIADEKTEDKDGNEITISGNIRQDSLEERKAKYDEIDKGDVYISADRRIILNAREGVLLQCGPVKVGLSQTGLDLCCGKLGGPDEHSGPFDASISLKTNGDFDMRGKKFMGCFDRSVALFDGFGGMLSMTMGRASLSGSAVTIEAVTTLSSMFNGIVGIMNMVDQVASLYTQNKTTSQMSNQTFIASNVAQTIGSFVTKTAKQKKPKEKIDYVSAALDIVYNIFDSVKTAFERKRAEQYAIHYDKDSKKFYNEDNRFATWAACTIVDLNLQATMIGLMLGTSWDALIHKASISLTPSADIRLDSKQYFQAAILEQNAQGPAACAEVAAGEDNGGGAGGEAPQPNPQPAQNNKDVKGKVMDMAKTFSKVAMLETKAFAKYSLDDDTKQALKDL
ncbi:MAG: hypothetical protein IKR09_01800 [Alphaproteobacteria bacterium]|nr:hypothetical protein [Alphaproteobacteria bacterium]